MMPVISRSQMQVGYMRVDLRRRNVTVSEQLLNGTRIGAVLQQMRRKAVSQRVWRNIFDAGRFPVSLDHGPRHLSRKRPATMKENKRGSSSAVSGFYCRILL
jgi:hypothetical protein